MALDPMPATKPVTTGGAGPRAPVDAFTAKVPIMGGVPEQQAELGVEAAEGQQQAAAAAEGKLGADAAASAEREAARQQADAAVYSGAVQNFQQSMDARAQKIATESDRAVAEATSKKYIDHWAEQSTGTKVRAAIASFLDGLATGRPSSRAQEWIDRDYGQQQAEMKRLWKVAEAKGAEGRDLEHLMEAGQRALATGYAARVEAVKREIDHEAAKRGTEMANVNAIKLKAEIDKNAAVRKQKIAEELREQVMTHTHKGLGLAGLQRKRLPDGSIIWKNPATGLWDPLVTGPVVPGHASQKSLVPTQPPPQVTP